MTQNSYHILARKRLLKQIKQQVRARLGPQSMKMREYAIEYKKEFRGAWGQSSRDELLRSVESHQIILGGDFHAFAQAQRTHLRILRQISSSRSVVLGLECIEMKNQKDVDLFMQDEISEDQFLQAVNWSEHWEFSWQHYRIFFKLAKKRGFKVVALNHYDEEKSVQTLIKRDKIAAQKINELAISQPQSLIYVVFGDLHLAGVHLSRQLTKLNPKIKNQIVTLFQNSEHLYFRLARKNLENEIDILKKNSRNFCILESPPWVKWQSYLIYLEQTYDHDFYDDNEDDEDTDLDFTDQVATYVRLLSEDLNLEIDLNELAVYLPEDREFFEQWNVQLKDFEKQIAKLQVESDRSFYLPEVGFTYLSRPSLNHAASLAGQYLHAQISGRKKNAWSMPEDFKALIWIELFGFFFSKMINHKRKPDNFRDLKIQLESQSTKNRGIDALSLAVDYRVGEVIELRGVQRKRKTYRPKSSMSYMEAARILGSMKGDRLYQAYRGGKLSTDVLKDYMKINPFSRNFNKSYLTLIKRLEFENQYQI